MNKTIERVLEAIRDYAVDWHTSGRTVFEFEDANVKLEQGTAEYHAVKLLYHNFVIWHYIDLYKSEDSNEVLFVYDKGIEHNKYRNQTIEDFDMVVCKDQKGTGKINSETVGSIVDRVGIQFIKWLHLVQDNDPRADMIKDQLDILVNCASELLDDMASGERQCIVFSRFKIEYSEK